MSNTGTNHKPHNTQQRSTAVSGQLNLKLINRAVSFNTTELKIFRFYNVKNQSQFGRILKKSLIPTVVRFV